MNKQRVIRGKSKDFTPVMVQLPDASIKALQKLTGETTASGAVVQALNMLTQQSGVDYPRVEYLGQPVGIPDAIVGVMKRMSQDGKGAAEIHKWLQDEHPDVTCSYATVYAIVMGRRRADVPPAEVGHA